MVNVAVAADRDLAAGIVAAVYRSLHSTFPERRPNRISMSISFSGRRAITMAEMSELQQSIFGAEKIGRALANYRPDASDVIITPFAKCGTTWLQQTVHTLRTGGDMDFDDISRVIPWIEMSVILGIDINAAQRGSPRAFKSHASWAAVPKGARYLVSLRDPKDAFVSHYRFMEGWFFEPGSIGYDAYLEGLLAARASGMDYWSHLVSWWEQRDNPNVLLLSYEHMIDDPVASIRLIAGFLDVELTDALLARTLEYTSFDFMRRHNDLFDDGMMRRHSEQPGGVPAGSDSTKVRKGGVGGHRQELPASVSAALDAVWATDTAPQTGFADYAALERALRARHLIG